ncbi:ATP binding microtubule motor family protein [Zea mays]|uniref:HECT-type E3 ubiquitin transferase n=1 Tax=Zea mays TaxID=4577 RepID=A0A1D6QVC3_MAIZE|nr:ATP binding microtubule motor family protein [Zea mays]
MAVLKQLDFFSTEVQRVALSTAANICRNLPADASEFVMEAVPSLTNLLNHHDSKVLEHASVCLTVTRIAEAFAYYPDELDELCNHGLVAQAASLIALGNSSGQEPLSTSTYTGLIRLLSTCASGSLLAVKTLLLLGISGTLKDFLSGPALISGTLVPRAVTRPADQIFEIVILADNLLPHMPAIIIELPTYYHAYKDSSTNKSASIKQEGAGSTGNEKSGNERLLRDQPKLLEQFGMDLLPTMTQVYGSSVNAPIHRKCLSIIGKLMYYSSAETVQSLLGTTNISSFLAGILAWNDLQVLIPALQIAEIMMEKLPETFSKLFVREGVVHAVVSLICLESSRLQHNGSSGVVLPQHCLTICPVEHLGRKRYLKETYLSFVSSQSSRIGNGGSRLTSGLSALAQPFKLRLSPAQGEKPLRDYSSNIVLINPFASLAAVEGFLWPRVQHSEVASKPIIPSGNNSESVVPGTIAGASLATAMDQSGRRPTTRSKSSAAWGGTSKKDSHDESTTTAKGKLGDSNECNIGSASFSQHPSSAANTSNSTGATESAAAAAADLPSVMTCANYVKLPPYSTKEIMREKLLYAILEGRGSFHFS